MTQSLTPSLLLDPAVTYLLISVTDNGWMAEVRADGIVAKRDGFETSSDAYNWLFGEVYARSAV